MRSYHRYNTARSPGLRVRRIDQGTEIEGWQLDCPVESDIHAGRPPLAPGRFTLEPGGLNDRDSPGELRDLVIARWPNPPTRPMPYAGWRLSKRRRHVLLDHLAACGQRQR